MPGSGSTDNSSAAGAAGNPDLARAGDDLYATAGQTTSPLDLETRFSAALQILVPDGQAHYKYIPAILNALIRRTRHRPASAVDHSCLQPILRISRHGWRALRRSADATGDPRAGQSRSPTMKTAWFLRGHGPDGAHRRRRTLSPAGHLLQKRSKGRGR